VEDLLLVFDEIDDVFSTVGLIWRPIVSFLAAVALFVATGFVFITFPIAAEMLAVGLVGLGLLEMVRQRRLSHDNASDVADSVNEAR
jgi:TRAP-type mannitol/chloroaromatic compound transport system permease large subunit